MKAKIVRIGNSRGIRIPRPLLEETGLDGTVDLIVRGGALIVRRRSIPRVGWDEAFDRMARECDDALLDKGALRETEWERAQWRW